MESEDTSVVYQQRLLKTRRRFMATDEYRQLKGKLVERAKDYVRQYKKAELRAYADMRTGDPSLDRSLLDLSKAAAVESARDLISLIDTVDYLVEAAGIHRREAAIRNLSAVLGEYSEDDDPISPLWEIAKILGVVLKDVDIQAVVGRGRPPGPALPPNFWPKELTKAYQRAKNKRALDGENSVVRKADMAENYFGCQVRTLNNWLEEAGLPQDIQELGAIIENQPNFEPP
jgi:hypothetical protein